MILGQVGCCGAVNYYVYYSPPNLDNGLFYCLRCGRVHL